MARCRLIGAPTSHRIHNTNVRLLQLRRAKTAMSVVRFVAIFFLALSFGVAVARAASVGMVTKVENQAQIGSSPAVVGSLVQTNDQVTHRTQISSRD